MPPPSPPNIILASASPRRRQLLEQLGVRYRWVQVEVDETRQPGEAPEAYVLRLALAKARAGAQADAQAGGGERLTVLAADTVVVINDEVLGKPRDREHGLAMLAQLSGRNHEVLSAVALMDAQRSLEATRLSASTVSFRVIPEPEQIAYWDTGEGADKAGAYAIQGRAAVFVRHLAGSYSGVMGLPLYETAELLAEFGISLWAPDRGA